MHNNIFLERFATHFLLPSILSANPQRVQVYNAYNPIWRVTRRDIDGFHPGPKPEIVVYTHSVANIQSHTPHPPRIIRSQTRTAIKSN